MPEFGWALSDLLGSFEPRETENFFREGIQGLDHHFLPLKLSQHNNITKHLTPHLLAQFILLIHVVCANGHHD